MIDWMRMGGAMGQGTTGLVTAIYGGINAGKENKKIDRLLDKQDSENKQWYDNRSTDNKSWYNANALSDYTQRADAQNLLRNLRENLAKQNRAQANMAVVTGATPEQQAIQKEQSNKVIADVYSNLGSMGQQWKDQISNKYLDRLDMLDNQYRGMQYDIFGRRLGRHESQLENYSTLVRNGLNTLGDSFKTSAGAGFTGSMDKMPAGASGGGFSGGGG